MSHINYEESMIQPSTKEYGTSENFGYKQELRRTLTLRDLVIYGMVLMAPLAPMQVYGLVSQQSFGMAPLVYLVGIIAMLFTAMSYRHMSREFPIAGSVYSYVQRTVNPHVGFLAGWVILSDYILAPGLLYAFVGLWMSAILPSIPAYVWALAFIVINTLINVRGITLNARTNTLIFWLQIIALLAFIAIGIKYVFIDGNGTGGWSLSPFYQAEYFNLDFIAAATTIAVLGFIGFDGISTLSEEAKDPQRTVGKATLLALVFIGILFLLQSYMAALIHPEYEGLNPDMGFFDIAREAGGEFFYVFLILANVIAAGIAVSLNVQAATSRVLYSISRDNLLPFSSFFKRVHPEYQTPVGATFLTGVISIIVLFTLHIETIVQFVSFGATTSYMVLNLCMIWYFFIKKKRRDLKGTLAYLLSPLTGFLIVGYVWWHFDQLTFIVGASWLLIGIVIGFLKSKGYKVAPHIKDI